ncbi:MAG: FHA domain-containing protein [bacterium JZ-2024 1]
MKKYIPMLVSLIFFNALTPSLNLQIHQVDYSRYPEITVYFTLFNVRNLPLVGAKKEQFRVLEDGEEVRDFVLASAEMAGQKMYVVLLLDVSGSMAVKGKWESVQKALGNYFEDRDPMAEIALITFGDVLKVVHPFGKPLENWREMLEGIAPVGTKTLLYDSLYEGLKLIQAQVPARKAIILLTDGRDEGSVTTLEDVVRLATGLGVPIFSIAFGQDADQKVLSRLARVSGGISLFATDPEDLSYMYSLISLQLASQYAITYVTSAYPGTGKHSLAIIYSSGETEASGVKDFEIPEEMPVRPWKRLRPVFSSLGIPLLFTVGVMIFLLAGFAVAYKLKKAKKVCPTCGNELLPEQKECPFCAKKTAPAPSAAQLSWSEPGINRTLVLKREKEKMGVFKIIGASKGTQEYLLQLPRTLVGSGADCDLRLEEEDFAPEHFVIRREGSAYILQDLGSPAGTLLNNTPVQGKVTLKNGDRIRVGKVIFVFREISAISPG